MTPIKVSEYVETHFYSSKSVKVKVVVDENVIRKEYPLLAAVNRGADAVKEHKVF